MKMQKHVLVGLSLGLFLLSCSITEAKPSSTQRPQSSPNYPTRTPMGQVLPLSAFFQVSNQTIQLEVARSPEEQAIGLMYRTSLADDRGMLFPFSPARPTQFWMKNTLIPLDMLFLRKGMIQFISADVPPCTSVSCPVYGSPTLEIDQVIELRAGRARELGLKVGSTIAIRPLSSLQQ